MRKNKVSIFVLVFLLFLSIVVPVYGESEHPGEDLLVQESATQESVTQDVEEPIKTEIYNSSGDSVLDAISTPIGEKNAVSDALNNINNKKTLEIPSIPPDEAVTFINAKLGGLYFNLKDLSVPLTVVVLAIAGLVKLTPFINPKLRQYLSISLFSGGILGFLVIRFGPIVVGILDGFTK